MNEFTHRFWYLSFAGVCIIAVGQSAWATSTGLNNIPTTDTTPRDVLVLQGWLNMEANEHTQQFAGFKYGAAKDVELGVDWKAQDRTHGHPMFQAKYAFDIRGDVWRGVIGVADLSNNRVHNGEYFPYVATSLDLNVFRLHFGFAPQPHNERFFAGIDKMVTFLDRNLQLRADAININDKENALFSVGFLYELAAKDRNNRGPRSALAEFLDRVLKNVVLESWVSLPGTSAKESYTVKLNYVIPF